MNFGVIFGFVMLLFILLILIMFPKLGVASTSASKKQEVKLSSVLEADVGTTSVPNASLSPPINEGGTTSVPNASLSPPINEEVTDCDKYQKQMDELNKTKDKEAMFRNIKQLSEEAKVQDEGTGDTSLNEDELLKILEKADPDLLVYENAIKCDLIKIIEDNGVGPNGEIDPEVVYNPLGQKYGPMFATSISIDEESVSDVTLSLILKKLKMELFEEYGYKIGQ